MVIWPDKTRKLIQFVHLLKGQGGLDLARRVRHSYPAIKIVLLATYDDESKLREVLEAGVHGCLFKSASHETLPDSIRAVVHGEELLSPALVSRWSPTVGD